MIVRYFALSPNFSSCYFCHASSDAPFQECVYCLYLVPGKKIVGITFRGSVNLNDWAGNSQAVQTEVDNPAKTEGDESGQPPQIGLHYGFHDFLRRERLDATRDGKPSTKFDRIISRVEPYCKDGWT